MRVGEDCLSAMSDSFEFGFVDRVEKRVIENGFDAVVEDDFAKSEENCATAHGRGEVEIVDGGEDRFALG